MLIGSTQVGYRLKPVTNNPTRWTSIGISAAGDVTTLDFGKKEKDIAWEFLITKTTMDTLETYLMDTIKPGGTVSVTPDTGDNLEVGASGATNFNFMGMSGEFLGYTYWKVTVNVKKIY